MRRTGRPRRAQREMDERLAPHGGLRKVVMEMDARGTVSPEIRDWLDAQTGIRVDASTIRNWIREYRSETREVMCG